MRVFVLAIGLIAAPSVAADQFDLICTGRERPSVTAKWQPYSVHYRVDVAAKVYCRFKCEATETLASVDAARITFQTTADRPRAMTIIHYVDRSTGEWKYFLAGLQDAEGTCEAAPFSGFPAAKF